MRAPLVDTSPWKHLRKKEVSRQRKWQILMRSRGRCIICAAKAVTAQHCEEHRKMVNRSARRRKALAS